MLGQVYQFPLCDTILALIFLMTYKDNKPNTVFDSEEGYDKYAEFYDKKLAYLDGFEKNLIVRMAGDLDGKKVLDLGCGTGRLIKPLLEKGAQVCGADISSKMLKIAEKKFSKVKFFKTDAEKTPFKDDRFDIVVAGFLIVHVKDLDKVFREVYRILKPGGCFIVSNINQRKAPKLKTPSREEIVISSFYHIPKHVISALQEAFFRIERDEFVYEDGVWINQIVKAVKL